MSLGSLHALRDQYTLEHMEVSLKVIHLSRLLDSAEQLAAEKSYPSTGFERISSQYNRLNDYRKRKFKLEQMIKNTELQIRKLSILAKF